MRNLSELIVLIRGGGKVGSAIAHKLTRSHFRVCITELAYPLTINRGSSYSEAVFDGYKQVEDILAERTLPSLEHIYRVWRNGNIPVVVDPGLSVKPLLKPNILINAMMLERESSTSISDAPLVIGIGAGFKVGIHVHLVIEANPGNDLGKVLIEGESEKLAGINKNQENLVFAADAGVFTTDREIGDAVLSGDPIGKLNDTILAAPVSGVIRGMLRNEARVLANAKVCEIDPMHDRSVCFGIDKDARAIAGGVLEAIMMSVNYDS